MSLQITNSLTRKREPFVPLEEGKVRIYVCGPTVYGDTHVGNARPVVFFDVVRRYFLHTGWDVTFTSNFTDVDDKIINRARQDGKSSLDVSEHYVAEFRKIVDALGVKRPDNAPKVTENIPQIISLIEGLVKNGSAYVVEDGEVFFAVRKFPGYGKLSGKQIDDLLVGVRVDPREKKRDPLDFSLWKPQKAADEPAWDSPWGKGRPGWHIECSAMAYRYYGATFDIHGGGLDLTHPHHENEIAQSEAFTQKPFVRYWMHNNLVSIQNEKMSKSLGNIFLNKDFIARYGAETLKFLLLSAHYRSPVDFSDKSIRDSQAGLHRIYSALRRCAPLGEAAGAPGPVSNEETALLQTAKEFEAKWREALEEDFNTPKIFALVFDWVRAMNAYMDKKAAKPSANTAPIVRGFLDGIKTLSGVMNLLGQDPNTFLDGLRTLVAKERGLDPTAIASAITQRTQARASKDFATADKLRKDLLEKGVELRDSPQGTDWDIVFG